MIPKEQNISAYTSRRYSWPGKKVPRDLVDREKSGDAPGGTFSPDAVTTKGAFLITASKIRETNPQAMNVTSLMYRNRVIKGIIAIIIRYNAPRMIIYEI